MHMELDVRRPTVVGDTLDVVVEITEVARVEQARAWRGDVVATPSTTSGATTCSCTRPVRLVRGRDFTVMTRGPAARARAAQPSTVMASSAATGIRLNGAAPRGGVGRQRLGHVLGGAVRRVGGEVAERPAVQLLHRRAERGGRVGARVAEADPHREPVPPVGRCPAELGRDRLDRAPVTSPTVPAPRRRRANRRRSGRRAGARRRCDRRPRSAPVAAAAASTRAPCTDRTSPSRSTVSPARRPRTTVRHSSIRRPRVRGSTPHTSSSWGSSPPIPTPNTSRPGASCASDDTWRATATGWRNGRRYTEVWTGRDDVTASAVACTSPS